MEMFRTLCKTGVYTVGFLLLLQMHLSTGQRGLRGCSQGHQDVYFIIESSLSVTPFNFDQMMNFVRDVGKNLQVGQDLTRFSLTLFNRDVRDSFDLNEVTGYKSLVGLLARTVRYAGNTNITNAGKAMSYVASNKFTEETGRRPDRPTVCILLMEGSSSDKTINAAEALKKKCRIIALGILRSNYYELSRIGSPPTMGHVKTVQKFSDLPRYVNWVSGTICELPVTVMRLEKGNVSHDYISIKWEIQPYALRYIIHLRIAGSNKPQQIHTLQPDVTTVTFTNLKAATSYSIDAWAVGKKGKRSDRAVLYVSSGIKVPDIKLDILSVTQRTARVFWKPVKLPGVTYYITVREVDTRQFILGTGVSGAAFVITRLKPGASYSVELTAMHKGVRSDGGEPLIFYTVPDPPIPTTKYVTDRAVRLEWQLVRGADLYGIRTYDVETSDLELLVRVDETTNGTIEITPLLSGKRYKFAVTSKTKEGLESDESRPVYERIAPSNPRKIDLVSRTTTSIEIRWNPQDTVSQYIVEYKLLTGSIFASTIVNETRHFVDGLLPGGVYIFRVFSIGKDSRTDTENPAVEKLQTVPGKIEGVLIQEITKHSVTLQWSLTRGAEEYVLTFTDAATGKALKTEKALNESATIDGLSTGISYLITVSAVTIEGIVGEPSDAQMVVTLPDVPDAPAIVNSSYTSLTLQWEGVAGAIQYIVQVDADNKDTEIIRTRNTLFKVEGLRPGVWYTITLKSVGAGGRINTEPSEPVVAQTVTSIPKPPRLVDHTHSTITVAWDKVRGASGYIINIREPGQKTILQKHDTSENEYTMLSLKSGESYTFGLKSYGKDRTVSEESELRLMKTMPSAPKKPIVSEVTSTSVVLEWEEVKGASEYEVSISDKIKLIEMRTSDTKFRVTGLKPSTQYSFGLYSVGMEGKKNKKESERVEALTAPRPATEFRTVDAGTTYVELSWNAVRGAISYIIRYKSVGVDEGEHEGEMEADNPSFQTVRGLSPGVVYEFSVIAIGSDGSKSDPTILKDGTLPNPPDKPLVLLIGPTNATLSWNPAKGAISYVLVARAKTFEKKVETNTTKAFVKGLTSGTKYDFTVMSVGVNDRVNLYESEKEREQTRTLPPSNIRVGESTTNTIDLAWDKMPGAVYYSLVVKLNDGSTLQKYLAFSSSYKVRRLLPGVEYTFLLATVGSNFIESRLSKPFTATTVPGKPEEPELVEVTSSTAEFKWPPTEGIVRYIFTVENEETGEERKLEPTEAKVSVDKLEPGTWYQFYTFSVGTGERMNQEHSNPVRLQTVPLVPEELAIGNVTTTSLVLRWKKVKGVEGYNVDMTGNDGTAVFFTATENFYAVSDLNPGVVYTFTVTSIGLDGRNSKKSSPVTSNTNTDSPDLPFLDDITSTTANLSWLPIEGAVKYIVFYLNRGNNERKTKEVAKAEVVLENLEPGTWYDFYLKSVGSGGETSQQSAILDEQTTPVTPDNVGVSRVGMDYITVRWDKSKGASSYKAKCIWKDEEGEVQEKSMATERTIATFGGLPTGTDFDLIAVAIGQTGRSSPESSPHTENTIPVTPNSPVLKNVDSSSIHVTWDPVKGASTYVIDVIPEAGPKYYRETNSPELIEKSLKPGRWYKFRVQARDAKKRGNGLPSDLLDVQTITMHPSNVKAVSVGKDSVRFRWDEVNGADFYLVTVSWSLQGDVVNRFGAQDVEGKEEIVAWNGGKKKDANSLIKEEKYTILASEVAVKDERARFELQTRSSRIEIGGLDPATPYSFQFESVNAQGRVSEEKVLVNETTLPEKVSYVSLLGITDTSAMLAWITVEGIESYVVNITNQSSGKVSTFRTESGTITLHDLTPGTWYDAQIYTIGQGGQMNYEGSDALSFQTVPSPPKNFVITDVGTTTVDLRWDESKGVDFYKITVRMTRPFRAILRVEEAQTNKFRVEKLNPGETYLFTIASVATGGRESRSSNILSETTIPSRPKNVRVMDVTTDTAILQWTDVPGAIQFMVTVTGDDGTKKSLNTKGTVITIEDLNPGVWYDFWVNSIGKDNRMNKEESNIVRQQTIPSSPQNIVVDEVTTTTISLRWQKVHGVKQYMVFVEVEGDLTGETLQTFNVTRSHYTVTQLTPGASYSISAIAVGTSGQASPKSEAVIQATVPGSLDEVRITDVSTSHVALEWNEITGAELYTIHMRGPGSGKILKSIDTRQASHVVTPLEPGMTYMFSVMVTGENGKKSGESPQVQVQTAPLSPADIEVGDITTTSVELSWKPVQGMKLYRITITTEDDPSTVVRTEDVQKIQHTLLQLSPGTTYLLSLITIGTSGRESIKSPTITVTTLPARPSDVTITDVTTTTISFEWNPVVGARHFTVFVTGEDGTSNKFSTSDPKAIAQGLSPGTWYEVYVRSRGKESGNPQPSETLREQTAPLSPSKLLITDVGTTSISFQWEPVIGVKFYEVTIRHTEEGDSEEKSQTLIADDTDHTVPQLIPGVTYTITVTAVGASGRKSSPSLPVTQTTVPAALDEVIITETTTTTIGLMWYKVKGASTYTIVMRSANDKTGRIIKSFDTTSTTYQVSKLEPGETYLFSIKSTGYQGKISKESPRVEAQTVPLSPSDIQVTDVGTTTISLSWEKVIGAGFYRVLVRDEDGVKVQTDEVRGSSHAVENLRPGRKYTFTIKTVGTSGLDSEASDPVVQYTKPSVATDITLTDVQTTSITVEWNKVSGAEKYKVTTRMSGSKEKEEYTSFSTRYVLSDLNMGTEYKISIISIGPDGQESMESERMIEQTVPAPPSSLKLVEITETTATLKWTRMSGAVGYIVIVNEVFFELEMRVETNDTQITVEDLSPGTDYQFSVLSVGPNNRINQQESEKLREQTVSSPTQGLLIGVVTTTTVMLRWTRAPGVERYIVKARDHATGVVLQTFDVPTLKQLVEGLKPGKNYSFTVTSVARNGRESEESDPVVVSTKLSIPGKPILDTVTASTASMTWPETEGAVEYVVTIYDIERGSSRQMKVDEELAIVRGLSPGFSYEFSIVAVGESGIVSEEGQRATAEMVPPTPTLSSTGISTGTIKLSWDEAKGASRYIVIARWRIPNTLRTNEVNVSTTATTHEFELPLPGVEYELSIIAVGKNGQSEESGALVESTLPESPGSLSVTDIQSNGASLTWEHIPGSSSYEVIVTKRETSEEVESMISYRSFTQLTKLESGTWYTATVYSRDSKQRVNPDGSATASFQTTPDKPRNLKADEVTTDTVTVSWIEVSGAMSYELSMTGEEESVEDFAKSWKNVEMSQGYVSFKIETEMTMAAVEGLKPGSTFRFEVTAVGEEGRKSEPAFIEETTLPAAVENFEINEVKPYSASIGWSDMKGVSFYMVRVRDEENAVVVSETVQQPEITLRKLLPGSWYNVTIKTYDVLNRTSGKSSRRVEFQTVPEKIDSVKTEEIATDSMSISWERVKGATSYTVTIYWHVEAVSEGHLKSDGPTDESGVTYKTFQTPLTNMKINQLEPGTEYWYEVQGMSEQGRKSKPSERNTARTRIVGISDITITNISRYSVTLSWDPVRGAVQYSVEVSRPGETSEIDARETTIPEMKVDRLTPGTQYRMVVVPIGQKGRRNREGSATVNVKTIPIAPQQVVVRDFTKNTIQINWKPVKGAVRYVAIVEYNTAAGLQTKTHETTEVSQTFSGLQPGVMHSLFVEAYGGDNDATGSGRSGVVRQRTVLEIPEEVTVTSFGEDYVNLSWRRSVGATTYKVNVKNEATGDLDTVDVGDNDATEIIDLQSGVLYKFTIEAVNEDDAITSASSLSVSQRTKPDRPRGLQITEVAADALTLEWDLVEGANSYTVFITERGKAERAIKNHFTTAITIDQLKPVTEYDLQVMAVSVERIESRRSEIISQITTPNAPGTPTVDDFTETTVELKWRPMRGARTYTVFVTNRATEEVSEVKAGTALTHLITDLEPGTRYSFSIVGENGPKNLRSEKSEPVSQRTAPAAPTGLEVVSQTPTAILLQWEPVTGARSYIVFFKKARSTNPEEQIDGLTSAEADIDKLESGQGYEFQVIAVTMEGYKSKRSKKITTATAPNSPSRLAVSNVTMNSFEVTWRPAEGATSYILTVTSLESPEQFELEVGNNLEYLVEGLEAGTLYSITAVGLTGPDNMRSDESTALQQRTIPEAPKNPIVFDVKDTSISLEWDRVEGAASYTVFVMKVGEEVPVASQVRGIKKNSATIKKLTPGTEYSFQVVAVTEIGLTSEKSESIEQQTVPAPPQEVFVYEVTSTSFRVNWTKSEGAVSHTVTIVDQETFDERFKTVEDRESAIFKRLEPGVVYKVTVNARTKGIDATSKDSYRLFQRTLPSPPTSLRVTGFTDTTVSLQWRSTQGAATYTVNIYEEMEGVEKYDKLFIDGIDETKIEVIGLKPGTMYEFEVVAISEEGLASEASAPVVQNTKYPPPIMPRSSEPLVRLSRPTSNSIKAGWDEIENAVAYELSVRTEGERKILISDINETRAKIEGLVPNTLYSVTLVAIGRSGDRSRESNPPAEMSTYPRPPPPPEGLETPEVTRNSFTVSWEPSPRARAYEIELIDQANNKSKIMQDIKSTSYTFKPMKAGKVYIVRITAVGEFEKSEKSIEFETGARHPVPLMLFYDETPIEVYGITWDGFNIRFPSLFDTVSYTVIVRANGKIVHEEKGLKNVSTRIKDLKEVTDYTVTYLAVGAGGDESAESDPPLYVTTASNTPSPPNKIKTKDATAESVVVEWKDADRAVTYDVVITNLERLIPTYYETVQSPFTAEGLVFDTKYSVAVVSVGKFDKSPESEPVKFKTKIPKPGDIRLMNAASVTHDAVMLTWSPAHYAVSYIVTVSLDDKVIQTKKNVRGNSIKLEKLEPETTYKFGARPVGLEGDEGNEIHRFFTTLTAPVVQEENHINEFGIDERYIDEEPDTDDEDEVSVTHFERPTSLDESLSSLLSTMLSMPEDEVAVVNDEKVVKKSSLFRKGLWMRIESVRLFFMTEIGNTKKSEPQHKETSETEGPMEKLIILSEHLRDNPKGLGRSGARKVAAEISGLLVEIFMQTPAMEDMEASGQEDLQEVMTPILEELLLEVILGDLEVKVDLIASRSIRLTWEGKIPSATVDFRIREVGQTRFRETTTVDADTTTIRFSGLKAETEYEIFVVTTGESTVLYSKIVETGKSIITVPPPPPTGLKAHFVARTYFAIRWNPVRRGDKNIVYIVRLYTRKGRKPLQRFQMQSGTNKYITKLKTKTNYEVTVTSYDLTSNKQSKETRRLEVRTK